jgi:hypothetical protein
MMKLCVRVSVGLCLALVLGCGSSSPPPAGKSCSLNSECNNPLSCTFGKCHVACTVTRDCSPGQRCVKAEGGNVCQLGEEKLCPPGGTCRTPLVCAVDSQCRNNCTTVADCTAGQVCAAGGVCAEVDETTPDGKLKTPDAGASSPDAGAGIDAPLAGDSGAATDVAPTTGVGPCGVPESEPNDKREQSTPITAPATFTSCIGEPKDVDFYELTAPSDPGGGYYQIDITNITDWDVDMAAYTVIDQGQIGEIYASTDGQDLHAFLAVAPGLKYRLAVAGFGTVNNAPAPYTMKVSYTKVDDALEPNNTKDTAKAITLGAPVTGFLFEGIKTTPVKVEDVSDWYSVTGAAGNLTVTVENVPANLTAYVEIYDSANKMAYGYSGNDGANATVTLMGAAAGPYKILVRPFVVRQGLFFDKAALPTDLPDHFTRPYKLTVTQ